jgi:hypothetical protein
MTQAKNNPAKGFPPHQNAKGTKPVKTKKKDIKTEE